MDNNNNPAPDFQIQWQNPSARQLEHVSIQTLMQNGGLSAARSVRNAVASLHTETTYIEVSDLEWEQPATLTFTPYRIGFSCLISSTASIQYGFGDTPTHTAKTGNILLMLPHQPIQAHIQPGRQSTVTCSFDNDYAETILGPLDTLPLQRANQTLDLHSALISGILLRLMQEAIYPGAISRSIVDSFGQAMLTECAHWLTKLPTLPHASASQQIPSRKKPSLTARDLELIERHIAQSSGRFPGVAELAALCGLSERYFAKCFREQTSVSVSQYLKAIRMTKAKALLAETGLPLKEIAYRLGYSSVTNFSSAFRSSTGLPPGKFREEQ